LWDSQLKDLFHRIGSWFSTSFNNTGKIPATFFWMSSQWSSSNFADNLTKSW
jgi:hypothetical protein